MGKKANEEEQSDREEAVRLKTLAEKKFNSSNLSSALKYATRAHRLSPAVAGVAEMATSFRILHAADSSDSGPEWYEILDLEPFSHINSIKSQYKKLALILHPDKSSLEASGDAFKLLNDAFQVLSDKVRRREYDTKLRVALQNQAAEVSLGDTFWTTCSRCRLLHQFERKYVDQSLVCPNCRERFKAVEVSPEGAKRSSKARVSSEIGGEKKTNSKAKRKMSSVEEVLQRSKTIDSLDGDDMTLAELRSKLRKKTNKKPKAIVLISSDMEVMKVEDSDFYDFDRDRAERSFKQGQVWAIYDDDDGMPRHYGLIDEVVSVNPFEVKMSWLDLQNSGDDQVLMHWEKLGFHVSCGRFKVSRKDTISLVNVFSHMVKCERVAREVYRVFPHKGSVWSLYNVDDLISSTKEKRRYEIVVCLTSYSEMHGISMTRLEKVDGFKTVFRREEIGHLAVRWIEKCDFRHFSHQIPARKLCDDDVPDHLKSCWELDPAALPSDLLTVKPLS